MALLTDSTATWLAGQLGARRSAPRLVVLPNPLPQGFVPRSRLDNPVIVTAGRLVGEKQFGQLVRAFGRIAPLVPDWRLRIFGDGPQRGQLQALSRKAGLYGRVELPGSTRDMAGEWAKASIVALCSKAEGYPLVLQEAMAAGVPAVSYDCPSGPREIIEHDVNGLLVLPGSEEGLAAALLRVATDADLRRRLGDGAVATAQAWDADALAERWEQVFAEALAARPRGVRRLAARQAAASEPRAPDAADAWAPTSSAGPPPRTRGGRPSPWRPAPPTTSPTSGSWCPVWPAPRPWWRSRCRPAPRSCAASRRRARRRTSASVTPATTAGPSAAARSRSWPRSSWAA